MDKKRISIRADASGEIIEDVQRLHRVIWNLDDIQVTPSHIYIGAKQSGGQILCAYHKNKPVGFLFGFPGVDEDHNSFFYSHNLGILKEYRNQGIGYLLKSKLRQLLLAAGYNLAKWTSDPLDSNNSYTYIGKLGSISKTYYEHHFPERLDDSNRILPSDRLLMEWYIASAYVRKVMNKESSRLTMEDIDPAMLLNSTQKTRGSYPEPVQINLDIAGLLDRGQRRFYLEIPVDFQRLKETSIDLALNWRMHVREVMKRCFSDNLCITNVVFDHKRFYYVLEHTKQNIGD